MMHCIQRAPTFCAIQPCVHVYSRPASLPAPSPARRRPCAYDNHPKDTAVLISWLELTGSVWASVFSGAHVDHF